jgi:outer membrane protein OmpA-like peptidoglycan-associated protein
MSATKFFKYLFSCFVILTFKNTSAQNNTGMATGNYAGISGVWMNPANAVDSRYKFDINIIGVNSYFNNNYLLVRNGTLVRRLFNKEPYSSSFAALKKDLLEETPVRGKVFARTEGNIHMPLSFLITTGKKSAIAFTMTNRTINKIDNLNPATAKMFYDELSNSKLYNVPMNNDSLRYNFLNWQEAGLTYGRVLIGKGSIFLKAAVTAKWLGAGAGGFIQANRAIVSFKDSVTMSLNSPLIRYGRTETADIGQFARKNLFSNLEDQSWGFNAGFVFEWRANIKKFKYVNEDDKTLLRRDRNKYILRLGVSVVDIGEFTFNRKPLTKDHSANFTNWNFSSVHANNFSDFDTAYSKKINYIPGASSTFTYRLPGAAIINADLHLFGGFYINVAAKRPLSGYGIKATTYIESDRWTVITPRFETKFFGLYVPVFRANNQTNIGATVKFGPVYAGSNNLAQILSNPKSMEADFHAGVRLSILHGKPPKLFKTFGRITGDTQDEEKSTQKTLDSLSYEVKVLKALQEENRNLKPVTIIINNADGKSEIVKQTGDSIVINNKARTLPVQPQATKKDTLTDNLVRQLAVRQLEVKKLQEDLEEQKKGNKKSRKRSETEKKAVDKNKELEEEIDKLKRENNIKDAVLIAGTTAAVVSSVDKKNKKDTAADKTVIDSTKELLTEKISAPEIRTVADTVLIRDTVYITKVEQVNAPAESKKIISLPVYEPVYFATGVSSLKAADISRIKKMAEQLQAQQQLKIQLTGCTDATGSIATNKKIAVKRANAVRTILTNEGVEAGRVEVNTVTETSVGKSSAQARRVDIVIKEN